MTKFPRKDQHSSSSSSHTEIINKDVLEEYGQRCYEYGTMEVLRRFMTNTPISSSSSRPHLSSLSPMLWPSSHLLNAPPAIERCIFRTRIHLGYHQPPSATPTMTTRDVINTPVTAFKILSFVTNSNNVGGGPSSKTPDSDFSMQCSIARLTQYLVERVLPSEFLLRIARRSMVRNSDSIHLHNALVQIHYGNGYMTKVMIHKGLPPGTVVKENAMSVRGYGKHSDAKSPIRRRIHVSLCFGDEGDLGMDPTDLAVPHLRSKFAFGQEPNLLSLVLRTTGSDSWGCWKDGVDVSESNKEEEKIHGYRVWYMDEDPGLAVAVQPWDSEGSYNEGGSMKKRKRNNDYENQKEDDDDDEEEEESEIFKKRAVMSDENNSISLKQQKKSTNPPLRKDSSSKSSAKIISTVTSKGKQNPPEEARDKEKLPNKKVMPSLVVNEQRRKLRSYSRDCSESTFQTDENVNQVNVNDSIKGSSSTLQEETIISDVDEEQDNDGESSSSSRSASLLLSREKNDVVEEDGKEAVNDEDGSSSTSPTSSSSISTIKNNKRIKGRGNHGVSPEDKSDEEDLHSGKTSKSSGSSSSSKSSSSSSSSTSSASTATSKSSNDNEAKHITKKNDRAPTSITKGNSKKNVDNGNVPMEISFSPSSSKEEEEDVEEEEEEEEEEEGEQEKGEYDEDTEDENVTQMDHDEIEQKKDSIEEENDSLDEKIIQHAPSKSDENIPVVGDDSDSNSSSDSSDDSSSSSSGSSSSDSSDSSSSGSSSSSSSSDSRRRVNKRVVTTLSNKSPGKSLKKPVSKTSSNEVGEKVSSVAREKKRRSLHAPLLSLNRKIVIGTPTGIN